MKIPESSFSKLMKNIYYSYWPTEESYINEYGILCIRTIPNPLWEKSREARVEDGRNIEPLDLTTIGELIPRILKPASAELIGTDFTPKGLCVFLETRIVQHFRENGGGRYGVANSIHALIPDLIEQLVDDPSFAKEAADFYHESIRRSLSARK